MERLPKGLYSAEFRAEAVKLVEQKGMSIDRAAKQLSIPKSSLSNWVRAAKKGQLAAVGHFTPAMCMRCAPTTSMLNMQPTN